MTALTDDGRDRMRLRHFVRFQQVVRFRIHGSLFPALFAKSS